MRFRKRKLKTFLIAMLIFTLLLPTQSLRFDNVEAADADALIAHYDMTRDNGKLTDVTTNGFDAEYVGFTDDDFILENGDNILTFDGDKGKYVMLPRGLIDDETFTIETKFTTKRANHWLYTLGTKENTWPNVNNYLFFNPMQQDNGSVRFGIKDSNTELLFQDKSLQLDKTTTFTAVFSEQLITFYVDGLVVGELEHSYSIQDIIENGTNSGDEFIGYIGKSLYTPDPAFRGTLSEFKVYNYSLTGTEVMDKFLNQNKLLVHYDMSSADGKLIDITGNGYDAEYVGFTEEDFVNRQDDTILAFTGDKSKYVKLPRGIIDDETFTIETTFSTNTKENHWLYTFGTKEERWPNVNNYIFLNPLQGNGTIRFGLKDSTTEKLLGGNISIEPGESTTIIAAFKQGIVTLYVNGVNKGVLDHGFSITDIIANGVNAADDFIGYIGKSLYIPDAAFSGELSEFKVYNFTLTDDQISSNPPLSDEQKVELALLELDIPNGDDIRGNITLPATSKLGATITWTTDRADVVNVDPIEVENYDDAPPGTVTRQDEDTTVTLTATVTSGSVTDSKEITLLVKAKPEPLAEFEGYLFTHFTGESATGEQIYFATSQDGMHWKDLNKSKPVLTSTIGEKGVRDPHIVRSPEGDKFYLLATDLRIASGKGWGEASGNGSKYLIIWESTDLVNWSEARMVKIGPPDSGSNWAPEAIYDNKTGEYLVIWAVNKPSLDIPHKIYYSKTRDFYTFTEPQIYIDPPGQSIIDTTIIEVDGQYYRYSRDSGILIETSDSLLGEWTVVGDLGDLGRRVEGPLIYKFNDRDEWSLMVDQYQEGKGYLPLLMTDLSTAEYRQAETSEFNLDRNLKRHGVVLNITGAEYEAIMNKWDLQIPVPNTPEQEEPILWYKLDQTTGNDVVDSSGNGYNGTKYGDTVWNNGSLKFNGSNGYIKVPNNIMSELVSTTVAFDVRIDQSQQNPYMLFAFGNTDSGGAGNGYFFMTGNSFRSALTLSNWNMEQNIQSGYDLTRDVWKHVAITVTGDTAILYEDGIEVKRNSNISINPYEIGDAETLANYIGRSVYNADKYFKGEMKDFRIYNRALDAGEIAALAGNTTAIVDVELDQLKTKAIINQTNSTIVLPVQPGTDLSQLAPQFQLQNGSTITPFSGAVQDFTDEVVYTVTGIDNQTRDWSVKAVVMKSPILPGLYADPNIVEMGGRYYIYPTTDGFDGWSGTQFKVFSSDDLVNWTDHGVIFDVPEDTTWAEGNAWAPTAEEKDEKYYFYYSASQNIGVAVSDSPTGPFVDPLNEPLIKKGSYQGQMIDPMVFHDDDGQSYLYFGNGRGYVAKLGEDMISIEGEVKDITPNGFREAFFVIKRNGTYYFMWSENDTREEDYRVAYGTSDSPMGPITKKGVILEKDLSLGIKGPGHHSVVKVPDKDEYYIVYHRFAIPDGDGMHRETTIDRMEFNEDGTIKKVVPTLESIEPLEVQLPVAVTEVSLNKEALTLEIGETERLTATVLPNNASNKAVSWSSSDEAVATVSGDGIVTAVSVGTATITVTTVDGGKTSSATVTVTEGEPQPTPIMPVTEVSLNKENVTLQVGKSEKLTATVLPNDASNKAVSWTSSNEEVATVSDEGLVAAVRVGTATITVTTEDGEKTATATVKVTAPTPRPTSSPVSDPDPTPSPSSAPQVSVKDDGQISVKLVVNENGAAQVKLDGDKVKEALEAGDGNELKVQIAADSAIHSLKVELAVDGSLTSEASSVDRIEIATGFATVTVSTELLGTGEGAAKSIVLSIEQVAEDKLPANAKEKLNGAVVYDVELFIDDKKVTAFDGKDDLVISLPYKLQAGQNPNNIVVYFVKDNGELEAVNNAKYDEATGMVTFKPIHLSKYTVTYVGVTFSDVSQGWAKEAVEALAAREIVKGVAADKFNPSDQITRAEFVSMLMNMLQLTEVMATSSFTDVKPGAWYEANIATAAKLGIINGKPDGSFGVHEKITREDMAVILYKAIQYKQLELTSQRIGGFIDEDSIAGYAKEAVEVMYAAGIINGVGNFEFAPKNHATRAEAAVIMYRVLQRYL